jgi:hypothetical protein
MARRLGFESVAALESWEEEIVMDHFANFICDYLALGYTVEPDKRGLVAYIDLDNAVEERIRMLEERRFEMVLDPDKSECKSSPLWNGIGGERKGMGLTHWGVGTARDHYKQFVVGVVADDIWLGNYGVEGAEICKRGWSARETTIKMVKFLEFLVQEWVDGAGDSSAREKTGQMQVYRV